MKRILLLFGAGARTGTPIANKFSDAGYHVAVVGRSQDESSSSERLLKIKADLADPTSIKAVFDKVHAKFGTAPNVVVYNAASNHPPSSSSNPFSVPLADWQANLNINVTSMYEAGREAVAGFAKLPAEQIKTFIYVGNKANDGFVAPGFVTNGSGKNAAAYIVACAAKAFSSEGNRWVLFKIAGVPFENRLLTKNFVAISTTPMRELGKEMQCMER